MLLSIGIDPDQVAEKPGQLAWRSHDTEPHIGGGPLSHLLFVRSFPASKTEVIMLRTLVLAVFLIAWLPTGIISGVVMGRRHDRLLDRFLWLLLGAVSGALMVPLALEAGSRERPIVQPTSALGDKPDLWSRSMTRGRRPQHRAVGCSTGTNGRRDAGDTGATPERSDEGRAAGAKRSSAERARHRSRGGAGVLPGK